METVKKQADAIVDLEGDLAKSRKQEKAYEEALDQLQREMDEIGQENVKLKQIVTTEKNGMWSEFINKCVPYNTVLYSIWYATLDRRTGRRSGRPGGFTPPRTGQYNAIHFGRSLTPHHYRLNL